MELKINYEYTYFIYPYEIKSNYYNKYIINLMKNERFELKFFDTFKDIDLYSYFLSNIRKNIFQDFTFTKEKVNAFSKISNVDKYKILLEQDCIMFDYKFKKDIHGKISEKDGIFFRISNIEVVCFKTGICYLLIKTNIEETNKFSDLINFYHKFTKINNKNLKDFDKIKIQTTTFDNIEKISDIIQYISGNRLNSNNNLEINENKFFTYSYVCIDSENWNKDIDFKNIEGEFLKLSSVSSSNTNLNIDYEKLSIISNSNYMKLRINNNGSFLICSSTDVNNYTKLPNIYEKQYLYTYLIALHQRYYLKMLSREFNVQKARTFSRKFLDFTKNIWVNEVTTEGLGQKIYRRCKEKMNLEELFYEVKNKYDTFYKEKKIEKSIKQNKIIILLLILSTVFSIANFASWLFYKL